VAFQIDAPETIQLIEEISRRTGEVSETVVHVALRERLARLRTPKEEAERRAKVDALVRALQTRFKEFPSAVVDHGEFLYGEDGLPR
jgi:hypothetical protein